jgi:hypothetical protein
MGKLARSIGKDVRAGGYGYEPGCVVVRIGTLQVVVHRGPTWAFTRRDFGWEGHASYIGPLLLWRVEKIDMGETIAMGSNFTPHLVENLYLTCYVDATGYSCASKVGEDGNVSYAGLQA